MKKSTTWILIIAAVVVIWGIKVYNAMVTEQEKVETAWGNVETSYQRRADLIPNLVNVVKGYAEHESSTFQAVTEARSKVGSIQINADELTEEKMKEFQAAQNELQGALSRLIAVSESYPELKANENFLELQSQLEGTENRINVARETFNETAKVYNTMIRKFPKNLVAMIFGFDKKPYFAAAEGADKAPTVQF